MGFFVEEELKFPQFGVSAENCYVTIKGTFTHTKQGSGFIGMSVMPPPQQPSESHQYTLICRFYVYADKNNELLPLREQIVSIPLEETVTDPIETIYEHIKAEHFAGKTITDDL